MACRKARRHTKMRVMLCYVMCYVFKTLGRKELDDLKNRSKVWTVHSWAEFQNFRN